MAKFPHFVGDADLAEGRLLAMIGCELTLGLTGDPVLLLPPRIKVGSAASKDTINGLLEVIPTDDKVALFLKGEPTLASNIISAQARRHRRGSVHGWGGRRGYCRHPADRAELVLFVCEWRRRGEIWEGKRCLRQPGANLMFLYVRDGTNPNTLRLVVRAGEAGAETTVLDNIPT